MKKVVNKSMVAHLFANQSQYEARTPNWNFYFQGTLCNSYGSHFRAAVHHGDTVLINSDRYSVTTASQLTELRQACNHLKIFEVPNPDAGTKGEHRENFRFLVREYETEIFRVSRARVYNSLDTAEAMHSNANAYAVRFKIGNRLKVIDTAEIVAKIETRAARETAAAKRERAAREKRQAVEYGDLVAKFTDRLAAWRDGVGSCYDLGQYRYRAPVALRLTSDGDIVQTSQGVEFPARHARHWIEFVIDCFVSGKDWQCNGDKIDLGDFQIDSIEGTKGILKAGCHTVQRGEIEKLAALLAA